MILDVLTDYFQNFCVDFLSHVMHKFGIVNVMARLERAEKGSTTVHSTFRALVQFLLWRFIVTIQIFSCCVMAQFCCMDHYSTVPLHYRSMLWANYPSVTLIICSDNYSSYQLWEFDMYGLWQCKVIILISTWPPAIVLGCCRKKYFDYIAAMFWFSCPWS